MQKESLDNHRDINIFELLVALYQNKVVIVLSTLLSILLGSLFIFFSEPVFEAKIKVTSASDGEIAAFNWGRLSSKSELKPISAHDVFLVFNNELFSEAIKKHFFKQFYLPSLAKNQKEKYSSAQIYTSFSKNISIIANSMLQPSESLPKFTITLRGDNPTQVKVWLKQFVELVREQTLRVILNDIKQQNSMMIYNLQHQINNARETAQLERHDRIIKLEEKIRVAQLTNQNDNNSSGSPPHSAYSLELALLQAKIKNLSDRKSDDAFIPNLRQLQTKLNFYKSFTINTDNVVVFRVDGPIEIPHTPIAPNKKLILLISLVLGFMVGIFSIIFRMGWCNEQYRKSSLALA
ncbi:Wzz/FepE/Etk N-terminal domain-containing protein [Legionella sp.]|uniref:Wzz/FepE/Etk N-terminal domain-containing protein n=1 Tax=Legionella sp. TaxID=459 RepID=UPI003CACD0D7